MGTTGVFPVHSNVFKINTKGRTAQAGDRVTIADLETFEPGIDSKTDEWTPVNLSGWVRRAVTGKGLSLKFKGKRNYGDTGNDYIARLILATGQSVESELEWTLPNGDVLLMNCVIDLKTPAGGEATKIDALEFDVLSDGLPTFTPATGALGVLTFVCSQKVAGTSTQIAAVSPVLTGGNSYVYKINGSLPAKDTVITGQGWQAYTLAAAIATVAGNKIALLEIDGTSKAKLGGIADAVV